MATQSGLSFNNWLDWPGVTITCSASVSSLSPLTNLALPSPEDSARVLATTAYVRVDLGASRSIGLLSMRGNPRLSFLSGSDTVRWKADTTTPGGTNALDTGSVACGVQTVTYVGSVYSYGYTSYIPASPITARYLEFSWVGTSLTSATDLGRMWIGDLNRWQYDFQPGAQATADDLGTNDRSPKTGRRTSNFGGRPRRWVLNYGAVSVSDAALVENIGLCVGTTRQIAYLRNDAGTIGREILIGHLEQSTATEQTTAEIYGTSVTVVEDL